LGAAARFALTAQFDAPILGFMRLLLALLLLAGALPARAADAPRDPLAVLVELLSAPIDEMAAAAPGAPAENSEHLARIQGGLIAAAEGYESLRAPAHAAAAQSALTKETDPALKPFLKNRDASLDAIYRTLAVVDYTWALRFPPAACAATERRRALLQAPDGLFVDPDVGDLSPWMARLLGPSSFGRSPEEALDQASQSLKLTPSTYEKLRVRASHLTEELAAGSTPGEARGRLYCERADLFEQLARAHRVEHGPTLASLKTGSEETDAAASVFLVAAPNGSDYRALGAGFLIQTEKGAKFVTDAAIARGHEKLYAFAHPASDGKLGEPIPVVIERIANGIGPAVGKFDRAIDAPPLNLAETSPAPDELVRGLGPLRMAGPWTVTQGLVTGAGSATFQSDAVLSAEMAGSPVLNDRGEVAGLMIRRGEDVTALRIEKLRAFLEGRSGEASDAEFIASRNSGSASLLTTARPMDEYAWSAPGASAIESGLPTNLGGVSWEGGGGVGGFRPTGYAGPPSGYSSGFAPRSSGYSDGGSAERIGNDLGSALGDAAGKLMVYGMQKLFQGIYSLFHPQPSVTRDVVVKQKKAIPPPPPPPPPEPKITGLELSVAPPDAAPGQQVTLVAQLLFQGDYKQRSNISITFTAGGDKSYFGTQDNKQKSTTGQTDAGGRATAILTLEESVALNSENEFNDLDRAHDRQDGQDTAPVAHAASVSANETPTRKVKDRSAAELDALDAEGSASEPEQVNDKEARPSDSPTEAAIALPAAPAPAAALPGAAARESGIRNLGTIRVTAAYASFSKSKDIVPRVGQSPGPGSDCLEQLKLLFAQQKATQQQRDAAITALRLILDKYGIGFDQFQAAFAEILSISDSDSCDASVAICLLRANPDDWAAAKAFYGQAQVLERDLQHASGQVANQQALCASLGKSPNEMDGKEDSNSPNLKKADESGSPGGSSGQSLEPVKIFEKNVPHIFRDEPGHLPIDTPENRQLLESTASDMKNFIRKNQFGNSIFAKIRSNGQEVWVEVRDGYIRNGGINEIPRYLIPPGKQ